MHLQIDTIQRWYTIYWKRQVKHLQQDQTHENEENSVRVEWGSQEMKPDQKR